MVDRIHASGETEARRAIEEISSLDSLTTVLKRQFSPFEGPSQNQIPRLDLFRFDVGYRENLRRRIVRRGLPHYRTGVCCLRCHLHSSPVQELTEIIFGAALSRPQRPISSLCRSSFSVPLFRTCLRFPFELSWSHRLLLDAETITLLQENFDLRFGIA
jgi:hypothetical protein